MASTPPNSGSTPDGPTMSSTGVSGAAAQVTAAAIREAAKLIQPRLRRTPVLEDGGVAYKLEMLQHSGTFKARGATHALTRAIADGKMGSSGVVAASGGNHGAAVAWAAREMGVPANIFVPTISTPTKVERLKSYGAAVHQVGAVYAESLEHSAAFVASEGGFSIHAYEDPHVLTGAGTCAMEMEADAGPLDVVFISCGGGGLAAGSAAWLDGRTEIVICETETTNAFAASVAAGERQTVEVSGIAADALGASSIGELAWEILSSAPTTPLVVSDTETIAAREWMWRNFRLLIEHSAAAAIAAHRSGRYDTGGKRVGVIVCGANTSRAQ